MYRSLWGSQLGKARDELSPAGFTEPLDTVNASQQRGSFQIGSSLTSLCTVSTVYGVLTKGSYYLVSQARRARAKARVCFIWEASGSTRPTTPYMPVFILKSTYSSDQVSTEKGLEMLFDSMLDLMNQALAWTGVEWA